MSTQAADLERITLELGNPAPFSRGVLRSLRTDAAELTLHELVDYLRQLEPNDADLGPIWAADAITGATTDYHHWGQAPILRHRTERGHSPLLALSLATDTQYTVQDGHHTSSKMKHIPYGAIYVVYGKPEDDSPPLALMQATPDKISIHPLTQGIRLEGAGEYVESAASPNGAVGRYFGSVLSGARRFLPSGLPGFTTVTR